MYIPKNKIITNLHTNIGNPNSEIADSNTEPFFIKETGTLYRGYYWKDYQGKYYTGKTPNDKPTQELIFNLPEEINEETSPKFQTTPDLPDVESLTYDSSSSIIIDPFMSVEYGAIIKFTPPNLNIPTQYYSLPTQEDYELGSFRRYFCVKSNESIFFEIDSKTYDALSTQNQKWRWDLYNPFYLEWVLTGDQNDVRTANFNTTKIINTETTGFQKFLKFNYLKFYQPLSKESTIEVPPRPTPSNTSKPPTQNY